MPINNAPLAMAAASRRGADGVAGLLGLPGEVLAPVLDGARARGIADAFDMMGRAAVLLDGAGGVLHVSARAADLLGGEIAVVRGHLVGTNPAAGQRIGDLIGAAILTPESKPSPVWAAGKGGAPLLLRAMAVEEGRERPTQLLKAVVLIDERSPPC